MARQSQDSIEALSEILGSLKITEKYALEENRIIEPATLETEEMSTAPVSWCTWTLTFFFSFIYFFLI